MSKNFTIDGREFCGTEAGFDYLRGILKELDVQVDDLQEWEHHVKYDEKAFMQKANEYFNSNDYVPSHEKLWASASYSVKKYFLQMGVKLGSHKAKKHAVTTMINEARKQKVGFNADYSMAGMLDIGWEAAERCHASFNELLSTSPEEWEKKYGHVEAFIKALNDLRSNDTFKKGLLTSLLNPPKTLTCKKFTSNVKETFGDQKYKVNYKIY